MALQWVHAELEESPAPAPASSPLPPPAEALRGLDELVRLGYLRGIQKKLDAIDADHPASMAFVANLRTLARGFQLDTLAHLIAAALADAAAKSPKEAPDAT